MRILDRYLARWVAAGSLLVLLVLLALFTFFAFIEEMGDVGRGSYGLVQAALYLLLTTPRRAYELTPLAALLGSLLALGLLASQSELTVMRASGVSVGRLALAALRGGAVLVGVAVVLGELVVPRAETLAHERRSLALDREVALRSSSGFWARAGGLSFINIRQILPDRSMAGVHLFEFEPDHRLRAATQAQRARHEQGRWVFEGVRQSEFHEGGVVARSLERWEWHSDLAPDLIDVAVVSPERLSAWDLAKYSAFLRDNGQDAAPYELALWGKLMLPAATAVMVFLALPFVMGPLRSAGTGQRVLVGALAGIAFHILSRLFADAAVVYGFSPIVGAAAPTALFLGIGIGLAARLR